MNAECGMMNDECRKGRAEGGRRKADALTIHYPPSTIHYPLSTIHYPPSPPRRGLSLLEVLVSMGVLSLGLLGVAMLLPIGRFAMAEMEKSDRTGMCGRAAPRHQGAADARPDGGLAAQLQLCHGAILQAPSGDLYRCTTAGASGATMPSFTTASVSDGGVTWTDIGRLLVVDPLGVCQAGGTLSTMMLGGTTSMGGSTSTSNLARTPLPGMASPAGSATAESVFVWHDDLDFVLPKDMNPPQQGDRPLPVTSGGAPQSDGNYSWFFTVGSAAAAQPNQFAVSAVVCYKRDFQAVPNTDSRYQNPDGEQVWPAKYSATGGFVGGFGYGGGTIMFDNASSTDTNASHPINQIREDQWVMLVGVDGSNNPIMGTWYRVVGVGRDLTNASQPVNSLSLVGPDWPTNSNVTAVNVIVIDGVTGVYAANIQLDNDATWSK